MSSLIFRCHRPPGAFQPSEISKTGVFRSPPRRSGPWSVLLFFTAAGLICLFFTQPALAGSANPTPFTLRQPSDTVFNAFLWGDEWQSGVETTDGYVILQEPSGVWVYTDKDAAGNLFSTGLVVGEDDPGGLPKYQKPEPEAPKSGAPGNPPAGVKRAAPRKGEHPVLVIVVDFTTGSTSRGLTEPDFERHFFSGGGTYTPTSVADYWDQSSYGQIQLRPAPETFGTVNNGIVFVTLDATNFLCGTQISDCHRKIAKEAILASDGQIPPGDPLTTVDVVDYALFDTNLDGFLSTDELHLYIVVRGNEGSYGGNTCGAASPSVTWGHRWAFDPAGNPSGTVFAPTADGVVVGDILGAKTAGPSQGGYMQVGSWHEVCDSQGNILSSNPATIGVSAHEMGHDLGTGMPDLYDTQPTVGTQSFGIGHWGLMGLGSWNGQTVSGFEGSDPSWPSAYSRWWFDLIRPTPVVTPLIGVTLPPTETAMGPNYGVYFLPNGSYSRWGNGNSPGIGEYWMVENRQLIGTDAALPSAGLLIWHIDETVTGPTPNGDEGSAASGNPRLVVLEQADGFFGLECYPPPIIPPTPNVFCNPGDPGGGDPWLSGGFSGLSIPNSNFYNGSPSGISVLNIKSSGLNMIADLIVPTASTTSTTSTTTTSTTSTTTTSTTSTTTTSTTSTTASTTSTSSTTTTSTTFTPLPTIIRPTFIRPTMIRPQPPTIVRPPRPTIVRPTR